MGTEVITYSRIGKEDIRFGKGTFEVILADGRKVMINEVDVGSILLDPSLSTQPLAMLYGGGGIIDDTDRLQASIDALGANGTLYLSGKFRITSTITVSSQRVNVIGSGPYATEIVFAPTAHDTLFELSAGASVLYQGSLANLAITSDDAAYTKIAIDLVDSSGYRLENLVIGGTVVVGVSQYWSGGAGSIGIRTRGREFGNVKHNYIFADRPLVIADNPNSTIDIDHFHFQSLYLGANTTFSPVTIADGVNLSNVEFDGANPWVGGASAFYWNDTTTSAVSNNLRIRGVRTEQGTDATAYSIYLSHNYALQNLHIEDCYLDVARRGLYLRKTQNALVQTTNYGGTLEAVNATAQTDSTLTFQECFFQVNSTATLTNYTLIEGSGRNEANKPIPNSAKYVYDAGTSTDGMILQHQIIATADLPAADASMDGRIVIEDAGAGDRNLILYAGGQRFRIDGGAAV